MGQGEPASPLPIQHERCVALGRAGELLGVYQFVFPSHTAVERIGQEFLVWRHPWSSEGSQAESGTGLCAVDWPEPLPKSTEERSPVPPLTCSAAVSCLPPLHV